MTETVSDTKVISAYSIKKIFKYSIDRGLSISILNDIEIIQAVIQDNSWCTPEVYNRFVKKVCEYFKCDVFTLGYNVNLCTNYDGIQVGILRFLPITVSYKIITRFVQDTINKNTIITLEKFDSKNKIIIVKTKVINKTLFSKEMCDYNKGFTVALLATKGYENLTVEEPECLFKDNDCCYYIVKWESKTNVPFFKVIKEFVKLFLIKQNEIPDYVWKEVGNKPQSPDDLKELYKNE